MEHKTEIQEPLALSQQHLERTYSHEEQAQLDDALLECDLALRLKPDFVETHNLRGLILEQLGQKEQAIAAYRQAVQLDPAFEEARQNLDEALAEIYEQQKLTYRAAAFKAAKWGAWLRVRVCYSCCDHSDFASPQFYRGRVTKFYALRICLWPWDSFIRKSSSLKEPFVAPGRRRSIRIRRNLFGYSSSQLHTPDVIARMATFSRVGFHDRSNSTIRHYRSLHWSATWCSPKRQ